MLEFTPGETGHLKITSEDARKLGLYLLALNRWIKETTESCKQ